MVFSSITFLFFFLPTTLALYSIAGRNRNLLLLLVSLLFYSWGEGIYLLVMLISIALNFFSGLLIARFREQQRMALVVLAASLGINFSLLAFFKYANFITDNLNILLQAVHLPGMTLTPVHLPIGISFFTFQATSYVIDVYRKKIEPQQSLVNLSLYISLFPQLIAGPIVRYTDIAGDLAGRKVSRDDLAEGIQRFIFGLSKKVLLANPMAFTADKMFALPAAELSPGLAWLGAICYTFQIYFDFSGYSDMAIGLGRMFGFRFLENFNYPYISKSIQEFWQRWHISLSSWFRDYLYIPLGGNRCGTLRIYLNLVTVFLLCGLWHGASWTFIGWGIFHGFFLVLERTIIGKGLQLIWAPLRHLLTLIIIIVGWVLFRSDTINDAMTYISIMFNPGSGTNWQIVLMYLNPKILFELAMAVLFSLPVFSVIEEIKHVLMSRDKNSFGVETVIQLFRLLTFALLSYFTVITLSASVYNPFIYFRF